jgi:hypothetical protein
LETDQVCSVTENCWLAALASVIEHSAFITTSSRIDFCVYGVISIFMLV